MPGFPPDRNAGASPGPPERPDLLAGERLPPPPKQERSRRKRDALLAAGLALFGERGYEETTVEAIAAGAGVAVGGFYQHFASKRQLLLVLMDRLLGEIAAFTAGAAGGAPGAGGEVRAGIAAQVRGGLVLDWAYAGAYRAWREAAVVDGGLRALHARIEAWTAGRIELLLRGLSLAPGARPGVDLATLAGVLSALFWRLAEAPLARPEPVIEAVTDLIYHALIADGER